MKRILITFFIFIIILAVYPYQSQAVNPQLPKSLGEMINSADDFSKIGTADKSVINMDEIRKVSDMVYSIFLAIATAASVIIATALGIKFMTGSVEEKAKVKDSLLPFVLGCVVVFGAFGIWKIVVIIGNNLETAVNTNSSTSQVCMIKEYQYSS
ncbi:MAG: pilin [Firmicutes bacterium]|nr:pilin [Bacillota bacterium]